MPRSIKEGNWPEEIWILNDDQRKRYGDIEENISKMKSDIKALMKERRRLYERGRAKKRHLEQKKRAKRKVDPEQLLVATIFRQYGVKWSIISKTLDLPEYTIGRAFRKVWKEAEARQDEQDSCGHNLDGDPVHQGGGTDPDAANP